MTGGRRALLPRPGAATNEHFDSGQQLFNVMHGTAPAQGDGRTDDYEAVQWWVDRAAAAGGGLVYCPPGRYLMRNPLVLKSGVTLCGAGGANSVIAKADQANTQVITNVPGATDIAIRDLGVDGNRDGVAPDQGGSGTSTLYLDGVTGLHIENVTVRESPTVAIQTTNCSRVAILDCVIDHPYKFGIFVGSAATGVSDGVWIERTRVTRSGRTGIVIDGGYGLQGSVRAVTVAGCVVADCNDDWEILVGPSSSGAGFQVEEGVLGPKLLGNVARACTGYGFVVAAGQHTWPVREVLLDGNTAEGCADYGFRIEHVRDGLFHANVARGGWHAGWQVRYCRDSQFRANRAEDNGGHGWSIYDTPRCDFVANVARANAAGTANLSDGSPVTADGFSVNGDNYHRFTVQPDASYPIAFADYPPDRMTFRQNRAQDDRGGRMSMLAGSATLTALGATFTPAMAPRSAENGGIALPTPITYGRLVTVPGAGPAGAPLASRIATYVDAYTVTLETAAATTVTGVTVALPSQRYGLAFAAYPSSVATPPDVAAGELLTNAVVVDNDARGNVQPALYTLGLDPTSTTHAGNLPAIETLAPSAGAATTAVLDDDFVGGTLVAGSIGSAGWSTQLGAGAGPLAGTLTQAASIQGHPGTRTLGTGTATGAFPAGTACLALATVVPGGVGYLSSSDLWDAQVWFQVAGGNTTALAIYRLGFLSAHAEPPTAGIYFERLGGEAHWWGVARLPAGTQVRIDTGVVQNTSFHRYRLRRYAVATGFAVAFSVDGGAEVVIADSAVAGDCLPLALALEPFAFVGNGGSGANEQGVIDRFRVDVLALSR